MDEREALEPDLDLPDECDLPEERLEATLGDLPLPLPLDLFDPVEPSDLFDAAEGALEPPNFLAPALSTKSMLYSLAMSGLSFRSCPIEVP